MSDPTYTNTVTIGVDGKGNPVPHPDQLTMPAKDTGTKQIIFQMGTDARKTYELQEIKLGNAAITSGQFGGIDSSGKATQRYGSDDDAFRITDQNTNTNTYNYTITVQHRTSGQTHRLDPTIKNGGND